MSSNSPIKGKPFDKDEVFSRVVKSYMKKKNPDGTPMYTIERANAIAQSVVQKQMKDRGLI